MPSLLAFGASPHRAPINPGRSFGTQLRAKGGDLVVLLWDFHVLALDLHQLEEEIGDYVIIAILALEADAASPALPSKLERMTGPSS